MSDALSKLKKKYRFFNEIKDLHKDLKSTVKTDEQVRTISMYGRRNRYEDLFIQNELTKYTVQLLEDTIQEQEEAIHEDFENIEVKCGEEAKEMIYRHIIDRQTQNQLAYEYRLSTVNICRKLKNWEDDLDE